MGALLGISFRPAARQIRLTRPVLPVWMEECRISNLRLGDADVDIQLWRHSDDVALHVVGRSGTIEVAVIS